MFHGGSGQEEKDQELRAEEDTEEKIPETENMPPPDDAEVLDAVEGNSTEEDAEDEGENEEDTTEETGLLELTAESEDWAAILCSDSGLLFPEGSSLSVLPITKEEEVSAETCQYLSEIFFEEKSDEIQYVYCRLWHARSSGYHPPCCEDRF